MQVTGGECEAAYAAEVWGYARDVLADWQAIKVWDAALQLRGATGESSRSYTGRFLIELLQNAHDVQPADRCDGRVEIVYDECEGEHGTLYVGNGGNPFDWDDVMAVCKLARSAKLIGEGIGNKGIGFRSVLGITTVPEIYSASSTAREPAVLDGFRFRFASESDLRELLDDPDKARRAFEEMPPLQVPFPIDKVPDSCTALAAEGMVTVIRMPLRNARAAQKVAEKLRELAAAKVPVLLFLQRLGRLVIEHRPREGKVARTVLERHEKRTATRGVALAEVDLGSQGKFIVLRYTVAPERVRAAVSVATDDDQLDDSWSDWTAPAIVEIALPAGADAARRGQVYTFLPLGDDVTAPVRAHFNAPFYTKPDRTALVPEHPLNSLLHQALAEACLLAADDLRCQNSEQAQAMAVELVSWDPRVRGATRTLAAAARHLYQHDFVDLSVVPCLPVDDEQARWQSARRAALWPFGDWTVLTAAAAAEVGCVVANPEVGQDRLHRLARTCEAHGQKLELPLPELAGVVERVAARLQPPESDVDSGPDAWAGFYVDTAAMFQRDGTVLRGRRILLGDDGTLQPCNGGKDSGQEAFFPPQRSGPSEDLAVPSHLRKRLFYLHPALGWIDPPGQRKRREARSFFERHELVREFDTTGLLEHVSGALQASVSKELRIQALKFVFRLYRSAPSTIARNAKWDVGLYVPSASGALIRAKSAAFGAGWKGTRGDDVAAVVAEGRAQSADLRWIEARLIAPPGEFVRRSDSAEDWRRFLAALGVTDGLIPRTASAATRRAQGFELTDRHLVQMSKVPSVIAEQWMPHIGTPAAYWNHRQTQYHTDTSACWLPGQDVAAKLSEATRIAYARLVLHGLYFWRESRFASIWEPTYRGRETDEIITPLAAFVREQPWLPVRGTGRSIQFVRPSDAWHCPEDLEDEPTFAPTIIPRLRPLLSVGKTLARLKGFGLPTWGGENDSARLIAAIGLLCASGSVDETDRPALQRVNEQAWQSLVTRPPAEPYAVESALANAHLLVERGELLATVEVQDLRSEDESIYIAGERDEMTALLVREAGHPLLVVPGVAERVQEILEQVAPESSHLVSQAELTVRVDDATDLADPDELEGLGDALTRELPWLPLAVSALADHAARGLRPTDSELIEIARNVRHIHLHTYSSLTMSLDEKPVDLPTWHDGVWALPRPSGCLILSPATAGELDWPHVAGLARPIAHAVGRPEFAASLRAAALELGDRHANISGPVNDDLARALGLISPRHLEETAHRLNTSVSGVLGPCRPVIVHTLGPQRARELLEPQPRDLRELQERLAAVAHELPMPPEKLVLAARNARTLDELRQTAGLEFAAFNRTLEGLHPDYEPISHAQAHEEAMRSHIDLNRQHLVNRLRWASLERFEAGQPDPEWSEVIGLGWVRAPQSWAQTVDTADPDAVRAHVEASLASKIGGRVPTTGPRLAPIDTVRTRNRASAHRTAPILVALIKAAGHALPAILSGSDPVTGILEALGRAGALDFRELDDTDIAKWLAAVEQWPTGMPATTDLSEHNLTDEDIDRERSADDRTRRQRAQRRRIITFGGHEFDVESGDYSTLATELQALGDLGPEFAHGGRLPRFAVPHPPTSTRTRRTTRIGTSGSDGGLSSSQRDAIGFIGEWFAYHWLLAHQLGTDSSSWISTNRRHLFPGEPGDDGRGFDFSVGSGNFPRMFEVKATQGDGGLIELGESEVRAAQRFARNDQWRILVVTSALDPVNTAVSMMPNPFSTRGREQYRRDGGSLRFSYRL